MSRIRMKRINCWQLSTVSALSLFTVNSCNDRLYVSLIYLTQILIKLPRPTTRMIRTGKTSHQVHLLGFLFKHSPQYAMTMTMSSCLSLIQLHCYPSQLFCVLAQMQIQLMSFYWTWTFYLRVMDILELPSLSAVLMITDHPIWNARHRPISTTKNCSG